MFDFNTDRIPKDYLNEEDYTSTPDKLLLSGKLSPVMTLGSFTDDEHLFQLTRGNVQRLLDALDSITKSADQSFKEASQDMQNLTQAKNNFLKTAEREADREINEKKYEVDRRKEKLNYILKELKNHEKTLSEALKNLDEPTGNFLSIMEERIEKTLGLLKDEQSREPISNFELEIVSKKIFKDLKAKNQGLAIELERLRLGSREMTPDTARIRPRRSIEMDNNVEEIDHMICCRLNDILGFLSQFVGLNPEKEIQQVSKYSSYTLPYNHMKCLDLLKNLELKIVSILRFQAEKMRNIDSDSIKIKSNKQFYSNYSGKFSDSSIENNKNLELIEVNKELQSLNLSNQALNRLNHEQAQEIQEIRNKLTQSNQQILILKQKISASKAHENELSIALRNQEASFEEKVSEIRNENQENFQKICEVNNLKSKIEELEKELQKAKKIIESTSKSSFERELDNVRKIYNDKYEELFKITSLQVTELEQKLLESNHSKQIIADEIANNIRKEEKKTKEQEFQRINQLHSRELRLLQCEFEDFLMKTKTEVSKLGKLVEKAINSSDVKLLKSVKHDIEIFSSKIHTKAQKVKDESFSLSVDDERACKRCGLNDNKSRWCVFHPYLVNTDAQEYLYGNEWHRCREANHSIDSPPCFKIPKHTYANDTNPNFIKIFDSFHDQNLTFANTGGFDKEKLDTPSRTLHEALFSTSKKENLDTPATDMLDNYLSKYS